MPYYFWFFLLFFFFLVVFTGLTVANQFLNVANLFNAEFFSPRDLIKIKFLLESYQFDLSLGQYKYMELKPFIFRDKKMKAGKLNLVLLDGISKGIVTDSFNAMHLKKALKN